MKVVSRTVVAATVALMVGMGLPAARGEVDFVVNALPASLLINMETDFVVEDETGIGSDADTIYMMPNISAGVGFDVQNFYLDLTGGAGIIVNEDFQSFLLQVSVSAMYMFADALSIGPRLGLIYFPDPDWEGEGDLDLDAAAGFIGGIQLTMGDRIMYLVSVDLITTSFDVDEVEGVEVSDDELEFEGLAIQFGVRGQF